MYFAKHFTHILSSLLVVSQLVTVPAYAAFESSFTYSYPVGAGLQYTRTEGTNNGGLQKANILTYTPNVDVTPIMSYANEKLYGGNATITNAVKYLQAQGKAAIGGANADFFVMSSGVPIGLVIDEGELISSDAWQYAIGFQADGTAVIGQPTMGIHISGASGSVLVSYFNKTRTTAGAYLLDHNYDTSTHFSAHGTYIVLERLEDTPVQVNHTISLKVVDKGTGNTPMTIADNQMILTKSDGADVPSWVDFPIGEKVTLQVHSGDTRWDNVQYAVGGKLLIQNGSVTTKGIDAGSLRRARSAAGIKADGSVVLYEIDGNQANHSAGLTATELGTELKELGCVQAVCLDGGGSSVMALRQPGETETVVLSSPSEGSERACANYIFFLNHIPSDGVTAHVVLTPTYRYILPGAYTTFTVKGADAAFYAAPAPQDLTYTVTGMSGTVEGQTFTAAKEPGTAVVTASNDIAEGSMMICVTEAVTSIQLRHGENTLNSLSLRAEQSIDLTAVPYHHNYPMGGADTNFHWEVSGNIGSVDENGVFTAGLTMGAGTLTCSYGATKVTIPVHVGMGDPQQALTLADFETLQPFTTEQEEVSLTAITDLTEVARGATSLQAFGQPETFSLTSPATDVTDMKYITLWARSENTQGELTAVFVSADGDELTAPFSAHTSSSWQHLTAEIPGGAQAFTGLRFTGNHTEEAALYLDQIVLSAHHVVTNTDAPKLTFDDPVVADNKTVTLSGRAVMENELYPVRAENSIVRIDGQILSEAVKMEQDTMTVTTGALEPGTHCITVEVSDDSGNRARSSVIVTIPGTESESGAFPDTDGHWAKEYAALLHQIGILQGETVDNVSYFRPNRNLRRVEFAVILARLLNLQSDDTTTLDFADEKEIPDWAYNAVRAVVQAGFMNGKITTNGLVFAPNEDMTRAEVMTVIGRTLPRGYTVSELSYRDADSIPDWAKESLQFCVAAGIAGGYEDNTIRPLRPVTRGEIAKILTLTL